MQVHQSPHAASTMRCRFTVNGEARAVQAAPFASLADLLRDELGLTGTKIGCDAGDCGACTVLLDGAQVCACLVAAAQADGAHDRHRRRSGPGGATERLRRAFLDHGAAQCGICTPGMLMAAADLLAREPSPSRRQVEDALGGVLCRCTGYVKIVEAVMATSPSPRLRGEVDSAEGRASEGPGDTLHLAPHPLASRVAFPAAGRGKPASARAFPRSTAGRRWPAPTSSAPTRRRPRRCGCAWCARRMRARRFALGDLEAFRARAPRARGDPDRGGRAGRELLRHLPRYQGPAGLRRRRSALPRRGGAGAGRHARGAGWHRR